MDSEHALSRLSQITQNLEQATLEDITQLLDCFNGSPILIDGVSTMPFNDPVTAARLNARYSELTGEEHQNFLEQQPKVLENLLSRENFWLQNDVYTPMQMDLFRRLKENIDKSGHGVEIVCGGDNHVLNRFTSITRNIRQAELEDVTQLLNYFNGPSVLIDGIPTMPFNDPVTAAMLNGRYSEFTEENHPNYMVQQPKVLDELLKQEAVLIGAGAYSESDFNTFKNMRNQFTRHNRREKITSFFNGIKKIGDKFGLTKYEVGNSGRQLQELEQAQAIEPSQDVESPEI